MVRALIHCLAIAAALVSAPVAEAGPPREADDRGMQMAVEADFAVVLFYAGWNGPSVAFRRTFTDVANADKSDTVYLTVNADMYPEFPTTYAVMQLPSVVIFSRGRTIKYDGMVPADLLRRRIDQARQ